MSEHLVHAHGVELCTQAFGEPADPAVLLIMGAMASMGWWPEAFCRQLAARGRFVIRFDHRDTGRSTAYAPGTLDYGLDDMADDALAVLDAHGIGRAHLVGMSLGGIIAQLVALRDPGRVATLTAISSTPYGNGDPALPGMDPAYLDAVVAAGSPDWGDAAAVVAFQVAAWRRLSGPALAFDEATIRAIAEQEVRRARNPASMFNHALLESVPLPERDLATITAPTLVIHGTADPVLPYPHGQAIAAAIPGARLLTLEGRGHELHRADWAAIVEAIEAHTAAR